MSDMRVANTILEQLGGRRFIAMTGSSNFGGFENSLSMRLTRNKLSATHLTINFDAYRHLHHDVRSYSQVRDEDCSRTYRCVFRPASKSLFTAQTGLYTRL